MKSTIADLKAQLAIARRLKDAHAVEHLKIDIREAEAKVRVAVSK